MKVKNLKVNNEVFNNTAYHLNKLGNLFLGCGIVNLALGNDSKLFLAGTGLLAVSYRLEMIKKRK